VASVHEGRLVSVVHRGVLYSAGVDDLNAVVVKVEVAAVRGDDEGLLARAG
jgi:hypothetical protein